MSALSLQTMTGYVTQPYRRGAETLELQVGSDNAGFTLFPDYSFREYQARFGALPSDPRYVLYLKTDMPQHDLDVELRYTVSGGAEQPVTVRIPGGSFARTSFFIPIPYASIPPGQSASLRLKRFRQLPVPLTGTGAQNFGVIALLGNIAKLAWVVGEEKDQIRRHLVDVTAQRHIAVAHGASLDALGADLRVPRFPARQYSFDPDTIALYHLDEVIAGNGAVADETARFGLAGHPGANKNAQSGVTGKFGNAIGFPGGGASGAIEIPSSADFNLAAGQSFTVECFVKADQNNAGVPALIVGKGVLNAAGALTAAGWSLMIGNVRGIRNNLRWSGSDGALAPFELFSDVDLGDGLFHHVACMLDRGTQRARLLLDGALKASFDITALAALTNAEPIRVGNSTLGAHQFFGALDEMRFSGIARAEFDPALGEGDTSYRRRLGIFRGWQLPAPAALLQTINGLVQIQGQKDSFVLVEKNKQSAAVVGLVRIIPASVAAGQRIGKDGDPLAKEEQVAGTPDQDVDFQPMFLQRHDNAQVDYGGVENNRLMQTVTVGVLDELLRLLAAANPAIPGRLVLRKSFDPADTGLHSVGRALNLTHETLALDKLAVFAHRAQADFVVNNGASVHIAVGTGEKLSVGIEPRAAAEVPLDGSDLFAGHELNVDLLPSGVSAAGVVQWTLIPGVTGRATLLPHPSDPNTLTTPLVNRRRLRVHADAPGEITLRVEYTLKRKTVTGSRTLHITVDSLADTKTITAAGDRSALESTVVNSPESALNAAYLVTPNIAVNFGADPNNKLMQIVVEKPLLQLLPLITAAGAIAANLQIVKAFDPADAGLHKVGRAIRLTHPTLDAGKLAALAHQAGFDFVRREGAVVYASADTGEKIQIALAAGLSPLPAELTAGVPVALRARFTALPAAGAYNWSAQQVGKGSGAFDFVLRPQVTLTPQKTGVLALTLNFLEDDPAGVFPYSFEIRLKDSLNLPGTIIPKTDYDLLMNVLNYFHPIGVEVITRNIREHVVEVKDNLLNAFPGYTYPDFRI